MTHPRRTIFGKNVADKASMRYKRMSCEVPAGTAKKCAAQKLGCDLISKSTREIDRSSIHERQEASLRDENDSIRVYYEKRRSLAMPKSENGDIITQPAFSKLQLAQLEALTAEFIECGTGTP